MTSGVLRIVAFAFALVSLLSCTTIHTVEDSPFVILPGTWGWTTDSGLECHENPHDLSFSDDKSSMLLAFHQPLKNPSEKAEQTVRYRILATAPHLRMKIEGETRTTPTGELVVWDLVLLSRNKYCWHRTDWRRGACTASNERCD